jgi:hypothetical protein
MAGDLATLSPEIYNSSPIAAGVKYQTDVADTHVMFNKLML